MNTWEIIKNILMMLAGLGVFMYGLQVMSDNLTKGSAKKLRSTFSKLTSNRFNGIAIGVGVTAVVQSSSAVTVMVVGLANSGILTLKQAASIIMGANIGTTVTGIIVSLKSLPITQVLAAMAMVGIIMVLITNKPLVRNIAYTLIGLGLIFVGMSTMSNSMASFSKLPTIMNMFHSTTNPALLMLIGLLFTAIIQSSSATTGILITMAGAELITFNSAVFVTLGINVGTCVTALIAAIGTNTNAKRTAIFHLLFNVIGTTIFSLLLLTPLRGWLYGILPNNIEISIAIFHVIFNLTTCLILVPFITPLVSLTTSVVSEDKTKVQDEVLRLHYLDERMLYNPGIALGETKLEINYMADLAFKNFSLSLKSIIDVDLSQLEEFNKIENKINYLNKEITKYLVKLSTANAISVYDEQVISTYYRVVSDIERIGDYAQNIMEYTARLKEDKSTFSDSAKAELMDMQSQITSLYYASMSTFTNVDLSLLQQAEVYEEEVDRFRDELSKSHIARLTANHCTAENGAVFLSLISNLERVADHMFNVAKSINNYATL